MEDPRVVGEAAGWGRAATPGVLPRDSMHAADASQRRASSPDATPSANMASMRDWMERVATSMAMSPRKKSSMTSLLHATDGLSTPEDRPQIYCFSPGRTSVQTLASVLAQRRREVADADQLALQAALAKRVRNSNFLRGDCGPRPLSRSENQIVGTTSSRPRGLLDAPVPEGDADRVSFLRANLPPKPLVTPRTKAVQEGLVDHAGRGAAMIDRMHRVNQLPPKPHVESGAKAAQVPPKPQVESGVKAVQEGFVDHAERVAGMLDRMNRADQPGRGTFTQTLHNARMESERSAWIVRHSGDGEAGEVLVVDCGPGPTSGLSQDEHAPPAARTACPERKSDSTLTSTTAERARKALLTLKTETKHREEQAAAQEEKKRAAIAVIEAAKQREAEAYSRRLSSVRSKLSSDAEECKALRSLKTSSRSSSEQRRAPKAKKVRATRITGPERVRAAQLRYSDRSPQQRETTGGGFYWTAAEEEAIATGVEGEAKAAAHFEQLLARGNSNTQHRYCATVGRSEAARAKESRSGSATDSDSEEEAQKLKGFKFRDPDAWDRRFESQASAPLKLKDEWYVDGECAALQDYIRRRVVPSSSCVLQIGCGNSNLGEKLHDLCGLKQIVNLDLSATVIDQMRAKRPDLQWMQGDALMLTKQFGEAVFDTVIDKGTLQSVLLMRGGIELSQVLAAEIYKVLRPGGRLVCVVGVQPGLAQYLKGPGLRWRISYKTVDGDGRPISIYTLTKPLEEASELPPSPQQRKVDHQWEEPADAQLASLIELASRIERNAAARKLGFKLPQARASPSQMRRRVKKQSKLRVPQSRSKQVSSEQGKARPTGQDSSPAPQRSAFAHFASLQDEDTSASETEESSTGEGGESDETDESESEDSSDCAGGDETEA